MTPNAKAARKRIVKRVSLRFFQDEANGEWGLTHKDTIDSHNGFNAFWGSNLIFHDLFEHSHEHIDKYFRGEYAMNIGGEIAAMGALWYYYGQLGIHKRLTTNYNSADDNVIGTTFYMMQEAIESGYCQFGNQLLCNVPEQKPIDDSSLENIIQDHFERLQALIVNKKNRLDEREIVYAKEYKESCTLDKLQNLYRYGFNMAKRIIPDKWENTNTLNEFLGIWDKFCKENSAEEMALSYRELEFYLYRDNEGIISWKAVFIPDRFDTETEKMILRSN